MNDLYHWHAELLVKEKMQEINRVAEQARLLKEAGLASPSLPSRIANILHSLLNMRRPSERVKGHLSVAHSSYRSSKKTECKT